jgi:hypothetical protein
MFSLRRLLHVIPLLAAPAAFAAPPDQPSKFYDMGETRIDGQSQRPAGVWFQARERARFERLLRLKKSLAPSVVESGKDPVLR